MPQYIRALIPGGTFFFTVALLDRRQNLLVAHVDRLREAFRHIRGRRPFHMGAAVILPDHLHCIWTLPDGDADFSTRWRLIKSRFSQALATTEPRSERRIRSGATGSTSFATIVITNSTSTTSTSIRSSMAMSLALRIGRIRRFFAM